MSYTVSCSYKCNLLKLQYEFQISEITTRRRIAKVLKKGDTTSHVFPSKHQRTKEITTDYAVCSLQTYSFMLLPFHLPTIRIK